MKRGWIFILVLTLLLVACTRQGTKEPQQNWRTGSQGLYVQLVPNLPPPRIYDDQPLEVVLDLENRGASTLGGVGDRIYLSGFDPNIITGISTIGAQIPSMEGKSAFGPGGIGTISFKGTVRALGFRNVDKYSPRLLVTSCYGYETIASDNVCIDPDPFTTATTTKVCTPTAVSMGGSQGAPVSVSSVEVEPSPGRTRFQISVTNVGGGDVFKPGGQNTQKCSPYHADGLQYSDVDSVQVVDVSIAGVSIKSSCKPLDQGNLRLTKGRGTMFCELGNIASSAAYTTPLTVDLKYGYRSTLTRDVTILRVS
ncbi:hypothetical protein HY493_02345 [Candidatus Woesearchaeota archaeon]|nr:hypothetical protein [Candidatus Woesearchaeota archaeon]